MSVSVFGCFFTLSSAESPHGGYLIFPHGGNLALSHDIYSALIDHSLQVTVSDILSRHHVESSSVGAEMVNVILTGLTPTQTQLLCRWPHQAPSCVVACSTMGDQIEVDLDSVIDRLLEVRGSRPGKQVQLLEAEIRYLCTKAREIFISQPILLELEAPIKVC